MSQMDVSELSHELVSGGSQWIWRVLNCSGFLLVGLWFDAHCVLLGVRPFL